MAGAGGRPPVPHPNTKVMSVAVSERVFNVIESTSGNRTRSEQMRGLLLDGLRFRKAQAMRVKDLEVQDDSDEVEIKSLDDLAASAATPGSGWELLGEVDGRPVFISAKSNTPEKLRELRTYLNLDWLDDLIEEGETN